jgi:hypothetical protein
MSLQRGALPKPLTIAGVWFLLFGCTLALYTPFLGAPYFMDDLLFYFVPPPPHLYDYFSLPGSSSHLYRPGEAIILTLIQQHFGLSTLPLHLVSMAAHATLGATVWIAALGLGYRRFEAAMACILVMVTQVGAPALLGNDTMSQAVSTALGSLACLLVGIGYLRNAGVSTGFWAASVLAYFASLFFKETALGLILIIALLTGLASLGKPDWPSRIRFALWRLAPYGAAAIVYFICRLHAGMPLSGGGAYRISVGFNVIQNLAEFAWVSLNPVSSVVVFYAIQDSDAVVLTALGVILAFILILLFAGLWMSSRKKLAALLACCILAALFPAFLLQHVSELYVYNAAPYIALMFALLLGSLWNHRHLARACLIVVCALLFGAQVFATRQKASMMDANGKAAASMMEAIARSMKTLPQNSEILLAQDDVPTQQYSVYVLNGLSVLWIGESRIGPIYGRPDVNVRIVSKRYLRGIRPNPHLLILELVDGVLRPID